MIRQAIAYLQPFRLQLEIVSNLPGDALIRVTTGHAYYKAECLQGHISPGLLRDIEELARHIVRGMHLRPDRFGKAPKSSVRCVRVSASRLPLINCGVRHKNVDGHSCYDVYVRESMMTAELCEQINECAIPQTFGIFSYRPNNSPCAPDASTASVALGTHPDSSSGSTNSISAPRGGCTCFKDPGQDLSSGSRTGGS